MLSSPTVKPSVWKHVAAESARQRNSQAHESIHSEHTGRGLFSLPAELSSLSAPFIPAHQIDGSMRGGEMGRERGLVNQPKS